MITCLKRIAIILVMACPFLIASNADSLTISGRVLLDGQGLAQVNILHVKTDSLGFYSITLPAHLDTSLCPNYRQFLFEPDHYQVSLSDTCSDSVNFIAKRQVKKTAVIAGQSNTGFNGYSQYYIHDSTDANIPYYCAYAGIEHGLNILGPVSNFGIYSWDNFGIEILLARTLYKQYSDSLAVMKIGWGGTNLINNWSDSGQTWQWFGEMFESGTNKMRAEGFDPQFIGFFWYQGESDRTASAAPIYADNLSHFVDRIRLKIPNDSIMDELPFVCVRIRWNSHAAYEFMVREAQMNIVNLRSTTSWVDIDDCNPYRVSSTNLHYNGKALNRIAYKLAMSYLKLIDHPSDSSTSVSVSLKNTQNIPLLLSVDGDTSFTKTLMSDSFKFPSRVGASLSISIDPQDTSFQCSPNQLTIPYVYHESCLQGNDYTFTINEILETPIVSTEIEGSRMNCFPNPFNTMTRINMNIENDAEVNLSLYDLKGRLIDTLCNERFAKGNYTFNYNAKDIASGIYLLTLRSNHDTISKKLLLLK